MPPITLDPADYWRLRAQTSDLEREQTTALLVQTRLELARERRQKLWTEIAAKYHLPMDRPYALQDDGCTLVEQVPPAPAAPAVERDTGGVPTGGDK
jgi:hypothetical protein